MTMNSQTVSSAHSLFSELDQRVDNVQRKNKETFTKGLLQAFQGILYSVFFALNQPQGHQKIWLILLESRAC